MTHVLIIGAGTGGLALAHGLRQAGVSCAVYERDRTRTDGLHGYRVGIDPDGSRALAALLPADLFATFVATCARPPRYFSFLTEHLNETLSLDVPANLDPMAGEHSVSRMTLRQVLLTRLDDIVQYDKTFARYEQHGDRVTAYFEDGSSAAGDLLVAADGTNSRVRRQYLPHARLEDTGIVAIAGKAPITPGRRALFSDRVFNGISMVMAPHGFSCIVHVMEFKFDRHAVKHGIGGNDAALIANWPGLLFDNTSDYLNWGFSAAAPWFAVNPLDLRGQDLIDLTLAMTPSWHPNLRTLFAVSDPSTTFPVAIRTSVPIDPWTTTNVTLLGDAIHTMTPGRGVGANTALRDARLLCQRIVEADRGQADMIAAVGDYERAMIRYGFEAVLKSREQMDGSGTMHRPGVGRIALAGFRASMGIVNVLPPLKRRFSESMLRPRNADAA